MCVCVCFGRTRDPNAVCATADSVRSNSHAKWRETRLSFTFTPFIDPFSSFFPSFFVLLSSWEAKGEKALRTRAARSSYEMFRGKEARVARVAYMRFIIMLQRVRCVTNSVVIILITGGP